MRLRRKQQQAVLLRDPHPHPRRRRTVKPTVPAKAAGTATAAIHMPLDLPRQQAEEARQQAHHGQHLVSQKLRPGPLLLQRPSCCWPRRKWRSEFILHQSTVSAAPEQQTSLHTGIQAVVTVFFGQLGLTTLLGLIAAHCCPCAPCVSLPCCAGSCGHHSWARTASP